LIFRKGRAKVEVVLGNKYNPIVTHIKTINSQNNAIDKLPRLNTLFSNKYTISVIAITGIHFVNILTK
jgi:hypothetical protein